MIFGNCIIELKLVEKLRLFALQPSHHGLPPPRFVSARWNHGSPQASTTSATKSAQTGRQRTWMPGTSPGTAPVGPLETIPGISTHLANAGVQRRAGSHALSPSWPGEATKLRFAPTSRPSTSFYVERLCVAGAEFRPRSSSDLRLHQGAQTGRQRTWMPGTSPGTTPVGPLETI